MNETTILTEFLRKGIEFEAKNGVECPNCKFKTHVEELGLKKKKVVFAPALKKVMYPRSSGYKAEIVNYRQNQENRGETSESSREQSPVRYITPITPTKKQATTSRYPTNQTPPALPPRNAPNAPTKDLQSKPGRPPGIKNNTKWKERSKSAEFDRTTRSKTSSNTVTSDSDIESIFEEVIGDQYNDNDSERSSNIVRPIFKNLNFTPAIINEHPIYVLIDTGSESTLVTSEVANKLGLTINKYKGPKLYAATNKPVEILDVTEADLKIKNEQHHIKMLIVKNLPAKIQCLLGTNAYKPGWKLNLASGELCALNSTEPERGLKAKQQYNKNQDQLKSVSTLNMDLKIHNSLSTKQEKSLLKLIKDYSKVFALSPTDIVTCTSYYHQIKTGTSKPVHLPPYKTSPEKKRIINQLVQELIDIGVVEPSFSPYSSPVVLVKKSTGDYRLCIDYRKLNTVTKGDSYPLPNIDNILAYLEGSYYFSSLDIKSGFYQVPLHPDDKEKTAFNTGDGLYQFTRMSMGLSGSPASFQRMMDVVFSDLKYNTVLVCLDDILVFSKTYEKHLRNLERVFQRLHQHKLTLNPQKCLFMLPKVTYLGFTISKEGIHTDERYINTIKKQEPPFDIKSLQRYLGMTSWYRKFIENYSLIAKPLTKLLKKEAHFEWSEEQQRSFDMLQDRMVSAPILAHFQPELETQLRCDASKNGYGCVLVQKHG